MMDYLRLAIGIAPFGIYLLVMGLLALRRTPTLLTSGQDVLLVGFALCGFALIGPIELFFPTGAYANLGEWAWLLLMALYFLVVLFFALQRTPGWTVLGLSCEQLRNVLDQTLVDKSIEHSWLGNQLEVPSWSIRAIVESSRGFPNTSHLTACGKQPSLMGWYEFEKLLMESKSLSASGSMISRTTFVQATVCIVLGLVCLLIAGILIDQDMARLQGWISRLLGG
ncbi:MAG: hypothetical protein KGS49_00535 [Planctomycetes bacterium]|nr:hypothetical protein [Planctomycetota bacterium]